MSTKVKLALGAILFLALAGGVAVTVSGPGSSPTSPPPVADAARPPADRPPPPATTRSPVPPVPPEPPRDPAKTPGRVLPGGTDAGDEKPFEVAISPWPSDLDAPVLVFLVPADDSAASRPWRAQVETQTGSVRLGRPPPGTYRTDVRVAGLPLPTRTLEVPAEGEFRIAFELPEVAEVTGWVQEESGEPVHPAHVRLRECLGRASPSTAVAEDGSFRLPLVPPGNFRVVVEERGQTFIRLREDIEVGPAGRTGLRLVLPRGGTIVTRLEGSATPMPPGVRHIRLSRRGPSGWEEWGEVQRTHLGGKTFNARRLPAGHWRLRLVSLPGMGQSRNAETEVDLPPDGRLEAVLRPLASPSIELHLSHPDGAPFTEPVTTRGTSGDRVLLVPLIPDEEGHVTTSELPPGTWKLTFLGGPDLVTEREVEVLPRNNAVIHLTLW